MPSIRLFILKRYTFLVISISLNKKIISFYSYCAKKGLVYIIIISPFSCQPSSYFKYTKADTRLLCNMRLVPLNKYIFLCCYIYYYIYYGLLVP